MNEVNPPSSELTDWQLKFSYWYVSNKLLLRKLFTLLMILINCSLWSYVIYGLIVWGLTYETIQKQNEELLFSASPLLNIIENEKPQQLSFSEIVSFNASGESFNLMSEGFNPNYQWLVEFEYSFSGDDDTKYFKSFILPGQKKLLLDSNRKTTNINLEIRNIKWTKINNFSELQNIRDRIDIFDQEFLPPSVIGDPSSLRFNIKNDSPFGYWETNLTAFLYSEGSRVSINYLTTYQLEAGDSRIIEMNWPENLPRIDSVEIISEVNYLNPNNIMAPRS